MKRIKGTGWIFSLLLVLIAVNTAMAEISAPRDLSTDSLGIDGSRETDPMFGYGHSQGSFSGMPSDATYRAVPDIRPINTDIE